MFVKQGHTVSALVPVDEFSGALSGIGCDIIPLELDRKNVLPIGELRLFFRIFAAIHRTKPDMVLSFTVKNNIYGAISARILRVEIIPNVTGLGSAFDGKGVFTKLIIFLYRLAFRRLKTVFVQNTDDKNMFVEKGILLGDQIVLLPGSGVDLTFFEAQRLPENETHITFLLASRMLWTKGVGDFVEAAGIVKETYPEVNFQLLGPIDSENPAAIAREQIDSWVASGCVDYLGETTDVRPIIAAADCVVLPSFYREGTPKILLEAAAMARPIVTTDNVGCREVVDNGVNGLICNRQDSADLARKIVSIIKAGAEERARMGKASRAKAEKVFDEQIVLDSYLAAIKNSCTNC